MQKQKKRKFNAKDMQKQNQKQYQKQMQRQIQRQRQWIGQRQIKINGKSKGNS